MPGDEDKLKAAAQLVIGAAAIYDESVNSVTGSQVQSACISDVSPTQMCEQHADLGCMSMRYMCSASSSSHADGLLVRGACKLLTAGLKLFLECLLSQGA